MFTVASYTPIKVDNSSYNFKDVVAMLECEGNSDYAVEMYRKHKYIYKTGDKKLFGVEYPTHEPILDCSNIMSLSFVMSGCVDLGKW